MHVSTNLAGLVCGAVGVYKEILFAHPFRVLAVTQELSQATIAASTVHWYNKARRTAAPTATHGPKRLTLSIELQRS